jgi:hypothetical protein
MDVVDRLSAMIAKIGQKLPSVKGILQRPNGEWLVRLDDLDVVLELDEKTRRMMVSVELSTLSELSEAAVLTHLLQYSFLWRETGCVYASLNDELRPVLMVPLFQEELSTDFLTNVLAHMVEKARAFTALIEHLSVASPKQVQLDEIKI